MEIIYKWLIKDYQPKDFWWFAIINNVFYIEDWFTQKIEWLYSEKKKKYYSKINFETLQNRYEFIVFKNDYLIVLSDKKNLKQIDDIEFEEDLPF